MKLLILLVAFTSLSLLIYSSEAFRAGGWSRISTSDDDVIKIGEYAVSKHNDDSGDELVFVKVVKGDSQVVAGINYRLVLEAKDGKGKKGNYLAVVWVKEWLGFRNLTSFKPV